MQTKNEKRKDILHLYPGSKPVWVDSGHNIPKEKPEVVIKAIRKVLQKEQEGLSWNRWKNDGH